MPVDGAPVTHSTASPVAGGALGSEHDARRRRLLVGALGTLPTVCTLASGAQAAVSSTLACWAADPKSTPPRFTSGSDTWLRAKVYVGDHDGSTSYCVTSPQNTCKNALQPGQGGDGSAWVSFNRTRPMAMAAGVGPPPSLGESRFIVGPGNQVTGIGNTQLAQGLVYVDRNATIATLDPNGNPDLRPVSASCWTSILGGRTTNLG